MTSNALPDKEDPPSTNDIADPTLPTQETTYPADTAPLFQEPQSSTVKAPDLVVRLRLL